MRENFCKFAENTLHDKALYHERKKHERSNFACIKLPYGPPTMGRDNLRATSLNTTTKPRFSEMSRPLEIIPLNQLPLLKKGDDLAGIIVSSAKKLGVGIRNRDLVVIGQKAVSKAEGRIIDSTAVSPSVRAIEIAKKTGKSPGFIEIV